MSPNIIRWTLAVALTSGLAGMGPGAIERAQAQIATNAPLSLRNWTYDSLYRTGWSAERLMDEATVVGALGDDIGSVENIIFGDRGQVLGIAAQLGGFWDIGDTHVFVPWNQVRLSPSLQRVMVPTTEETVDDYYVPNYLLTRPETRRSQAVDDDLATGPRVWKATDLIDDFAFLNPNIGYGYVRDLIVSRDGTASVVVVNASPAFGGGYRAFPYYGYGYGWNPGYSSYLLPYNEAEIRALPPFQYNRLRSPTAGPAVTGATRSGLERR